MRILLMRHAEATQGFPDRERPLSAYGLQSLSDIPSGLPEQLQDITDIWVSPYVRTRQTIEGLLPDSSYKTDVSLTPDSQPQQVLDRLAQCDPSACILLVTHMPLVGSLMSMLMEGPLAHGYGFDPAQIAVLECEYPAAGLAKHIATFSLKA